MPVITKNFLTLSNTDARELAGSLVAIGGQTFYFKDFDPKHPGLPPWRSGAEGKAYPLVRGGGEVVAYLKFFTRPTQKRLDRTAWLIGQQLHTWLPGLAAAPFLWTDTRVARSGTNTAFQFAGYLAQAVPGHTWQELKSRIAAGTTGFPEELRWRCVKDLLLALAVLEQVGVVHGDLSPNNVIIDLEAPADQPALYLIDFDAFCAPAAGANRVVTVAEGGTYGTEGYCPPDLSAAVGGGDGSVAPYSDHYGRDMLLLEFLLMDHGLPAEDPPGAWDREQLRQRYASSRASSEPGCPQPLSHLDPARVFSLAEEERPASSDLAVGLGRPLPQRRTLQRVKRPSRPTPAILGRRSATAAEKTHTRPPESGGGRIPNILYALYSQPSYSQASPIAARRERLFLVTAMMLSSLACVLTALLALLVSAFYSKQPQRGSEATPRVVLPEMAVDLGNGVKLEMVLIPAGEFMMGSPDSDGDAFQDEKPQHAVRITHPFYLGKYEVTQEQWEAVMGNNPSHFKGPKNPVELVRWEECQKFLDKLNAKLGDHGWKFVLPSEAQWEYACRAGSTTTYCYGNDRSELGEYAWYAENSGYQTHPVGEKKPNAWGLYDMHGNLWEWCADWYGGNYYVASPVDDPTGPDSGSIRVLRGGSWFGGPYFSRSADRGRYGSYNRGDFTGFRVARTQ